MKKITKFEDNSIIYLLAKPLFLGLGITRILNNTLADAWISITLGILIGLFINFLISKLGSSKITNLITSFILLVIGTISLINAVSTIYLNKTPILLIIIPLFLLIYYLNSKKEDTVYHVSSIILIINVVLMGIIFITLIPQINIDNFLPVYTASPLRIVTSSFEFALISCIPYLLLPDFKKQYNYKVYLLSTFSILMTFIIIIGVLGKDVSLLYQYPEYTVLKRISFLGFINNVENILFIMGILELFILMSIASTNIKKNTNNKIFSLSLILVLCLCIILFCYFTEIINIIGSYFFIILISLLILYSLSKVFKLFHQ